MFFTGYTYPATPYELQKNNSDDECPPTEPSKSDLTEGLQYLKKWEHLHDVSFVLDQQPHGIYARFKNEIRFFPASLFTRDNREYLQSSLYDMVYT